LARVGFAVAGYVAGLISSARAVKPPWAGTPGGPHNSLSPSPSVTPSPSPPSSVSPSPIPIADFGPTLGAQWVRDHAGPRPVADPLAGVYFTSASDLQGKMEALN